MKTALIAASSLLAAAELHCTGECQQRDENATMSIVMQLKELQRQECALLDNCVIHKESQSGQPCVDGMAGEYPCNNVDMLSFVSLADLGSRFNGNDIWGWEDPVTGQEWAIACCMDGTSFVDVTDPSNPVVAGWLPSSNGRSSTWRDVKVYKDHAYIGADSSPNHGMQVVDMTQFRSKSYKVSGNGPSIAENQDVITEPLYSEFGSSHNIVINEETGYVYAVGSGTCRSGLHIANIQDPKNPQFVGCFSNDGYTHDAQCVIYKGPDAEFQGRELCFNYNENTLTIVDVEDKENLVMIARQSYQGYAYTHQGWLTEDHTFLLLDDELDEARGNNAGYTQTYIWDVTSLRNPRHIGSYFSPVQAIDHNQYILDNLSYQANYESGLRVVDVSDIANVKSRSEVYCDSTTAEKQVCPNGDVCDAKKLPCESADKCLCPMVSLTEVAFFDTYPQRNGVAFFGAWSVYPYFKSGTVVVQDINRGLFVLDVKAEAKALPKKVSNYTY